MNVPCKVIKDLLPLYLDKVCSEESRNIVEEHLKECPDCRKFHDELIAADSIQIDPDAAGCERQKAASFKSVKNKIFRKQLIVSAIVVIAILIAGFIVRGILKNTIETVEYNDNLSAAMVDGSLVGRLQSSRLYETGAKRVTVFENGVEKSFLFFYVVNTKWDELTTYDEVYSEFLLCPKDKGADSIDAVYYYTGDYDGIEESESYEELQKTIEKSTLLWEK